MSPWGKREADPTRREAKMAELVPLWNWYGTRRHIDSGEQTRAGGHITLCGQVHQTQDRSELRHPAAKLDQAPLCQKCAKKAGVPVIEKFNAVEMATLVGLVAALTDNPESDDIVDRMIRRCRDIAQRAGAGQEGGGGE